MNFESFSKQFGRFHGSIEVKAGEHSFIHINLHVEYVMNHIIFKLLTLNSVNFKPEKTLFRGLRAFLNMESESTLFYGPFDWALLLGKALVFPKGDGDIVFSSSPYFVQDVKAFHVAITEDYKAVQNSEHIYTLNNNAIVYLDSSNLFSPGSRYYGEDFSHSDNLYRVCMLTRKHEALPTYIFDNERIAKKMPFKTHPAEIQISPFLDCVPVTCPLVDYETTGVVNLNLSQQFPSFIVQDILRSYGIRKNLNHIGLLIQSPITLAYQNQDYTFPAISAPDKRKCIPLCINGILPKTIIHVPAPYDRYFVQGDKEIWSQIKWVPVYFYPHKIDNSLAKVIFDGNILGFIYRNTFLCLPHVLLPNRPSSTTYDNVHKIWNSLSFRFENCKDLVLLNSYDIGGGITLHRVKYVTLPYDLYCIDFNNTSKKFLSTQRPRLSPLVNEWISLVTNLRVEKKTTLRYVDMNYVKVMTALARHGVCYQIAENETATTSFSYDARGNVTFYVDKDMIKFINELRAWSREEQSDKDIATTSASACAIL